MIEAARLRRPCGKWLFRQIKKDQLTMNRFEVAVKHQISLVTVRFAFASHNYEQFQDKVRAGLRFKDGNVGERIIKAQEEANDTNFVQEQLRFNPNLTQ